MPAFVEATEKFHSGELDKKGYKSVSGWYGSYPQRGDGKHMVRLRLAGGRITESKLSFIIDCVKKYGIDLVHITTCQTVQLHNLSGKAAGEIIDAAFDVGIVTIGGGGDNPRNVMASPLSGVDPGEAFDVLPFALATEEYLLGIVDSIKLPRKLKISFSNGSGNEVHPTIRDLGFMAKPNGKFDVYAAGGLGNRGFRAGVPVVTDCEPRDVLYCVEAMVTLFLEHGAHDVRAETRTRFMRDRLGEETFLEEYGKHLRASKERGDLDLDVGVDVSASAGGSGWPMEQKRRGMYSVRVSPPCGDPTASELESYLKVLEENPGSEIRLSPDQSMYFVNLRKEAADALCVPETEFQRSVACVGSGICQTGLRDSRALLSRILRVERENGFPDGTLPRVRISGCGSSCSAHQIGELGLRGATAKTAEGNKPGFEVFFNGNDSPTEVTMGESAGIVPEERLPEFFVVLGKTVSPERFSDWIKENKGEFQNLVKSFVS